MCVCEAQPVEASPPPLVGYIGYRFLLQVWLPEQLNNQYISSADNLDSFCEISKVVMSAPLKRSKSFTGILLPGKRHVPKVSDNLFNVKVYF